MTGIFQKLYFQAFKIFSRFPLQPNGGSERENERGDLKKNETIVAKAVISRENGGLNGKNEVFYLFILPSL